MLVPSVDQDHEKIIIRAGSVCLCGLWNLCWPCPRPGKVGLPEYLASLKRIDRALSQMLEKNLRVNQQSIGDCNELMSEGIAHLQKLFRFNLASSFRLVEPLHYITKRKLWNKTFSAILADQIDRASLSDHSGASVSRTQCHRPVYITKRRLQSAWLAISTNLRRNSWPLS